MNDDRLMNHKLHIFISVITLGSWTPFYLALYLFYKFSDSTIEKRRARRETKKEASRERSKIKSATKARRKSITRTIAMEQFKAKELSRSDKGYKKPGLSDGFIPMRAGQVYFLNCAHEIRAVPKITGLIGKKVWCDVCNAEREITSKPTSSNRS